MYTVFLQEIFICKLKPSTRYQRADATFHHWTTDSQRQGLTFMQLSDARSFERHVRKAIKEISPKRGNFEISKIKFSYCL